MENQSYLHGIVDIFSGRRGNLWHKGI